MKGKNMLKLLGLYKGVNPELFSELSPEKQAYTISKTIKELCLIAESGKSGAGSKLYDLLRNPKIDIYDVESLLEYGKPFSDLTENEKKYVKRLEIQQEFGHFSRIMNLDGVITGKEPDAKDVVMDFSRFLELMTERRNDRNSSSLSNFGRPVNDVTHFVTNSPACGLMDATSTDKTIALLGVQKRNKIFHPKATLVEYNNLINRFDTKTSTLLFDYLLYLDKRSCVGLAFVVAHKSSDKDSVVEFTGSGGCGVLVTIPKKDNFYKAQVLKRMVVGGESPWAFAKHKQTCIENSDLTYSGLNITVYLFHPDSFSHISTLSNRELEKILNRSHKNGWFNQPNALTSYLKSINENTQIISMKLKPDSTSGFNRHEKPDRVRTLDSIKESKIIKEVSKSKKIALETAHIHADRNPGEEQWECLDYTKMLVNLINENGFTGKIATSTMIDEYHVINRLNFKKYLRQLKVKGMSIREVIMESSPLIRFIAIDILQFLANEDNLNEDTKVVKKGGNLYLEFTKHGAIIELLANADNNPMIGCVLFDVALCLYKSNSRFYINKYNKRLGLKKSENINDILMKYYDEEKSIDKRRRFMESFFVKIPNLKELKKNSKKLNIQFPKSSTLLLNILAHFYKPQQRKVNMFLKILKQRPLYSFFYNSKTQEVELI